MKTKSKKEYEIVKEVKWYVGDETKIWLVFSTPFAFSFFLGIVLQWKSILEVAGSMFIFIYLITLAMIVWFCRESKYYFKQTTRRK